jgi:phasin
VEESAVGLRKNKSMAKTTNFEDLSGITRPTLDQARNAMESYLNLLEQTISASPWGGTEMTKKLMSYAEQNVAATFDFLEKLSRARDFQDIVRIQTEFVQTQLRSLTEQASEIGGMSIKAVTDAMRKPFDPPS